MTDWYARRHELKPGDQFLTHSDELVELDRRVPGDGTDWYVLDGYRDGLKISWAAYDGRIHPSDLKERFKP